MLPYQMTINCEKKKYAQKVAKPKIRPPIDFWISLAAASVLPRQLKMTSAHAQIPERNALTMTKAPKSVENHGFSIDMNHSTPIMVRCHTNRNTRITAQKRVDDEPRSALATKMRAITNITPITIKLRAMKKGWLNHTPGCANHGYIEICGMLTIKSSIAAGITYCSAPTLGRSWRCQCPSE